MSDTCSRAHKSHGRWYRTCRGHHADLRSFYSSLLSFNSSRYYTRPHLQRLLLNWLCWLCFSSYFSCLSSLRGSGMRARFVLSCGSALAIDYQIYFLDWELVLLPTCRHFEGCWKLSHYYIYSITLLLRVLLARMALCYSAYLLPSGGLLSELLAWFWGPLQFVLCR